MTTMLNAAWHGVLLAAGLGLPATAAEQPRASRPPLPPILVTPTDRVLIERGFVPVEGALRLYACVVGTPAGVHYAYDLESGALLSVWRGPFADMVEIWGARARNQTVRPAGIEVALTAKPLVAQFPDRMMIEFPKAWPTQPAPLFASQGYELEKDGQPTFLSRIEDLVIRDRVAPSSDARGLTRRLEFSGGLPEWQTWILLAESDAIAQRGGDHLWSSAGNRWQIEFPVEISPTPTVWTEGNRQQLVLHLTPAVINRAVVYTIRW